MSPICQCCFLFSPSFLLLVLHSTPLFGLPIGVVPYIFSLPLWSFFKTFCSTFGSPFYPRRKGGKYGQFLNVLPVLGQSVPPFSLSPFSCQTWCYSHLATEENPLPPIRHPSFLSPSILSFPISIFSRSPFGFD